MGTAERILLMLIIVCFALLIVLTVAKGAL